MDVSAALAEGDLLWAPSESFKSGSRLAEYLRWLAQSPSARRFERTTSSWRWSVDDLEAFWTSVVEFFGVQFDSDCRTRARRRQIHAGRALVRGRRVELRRKRVPVRDG